MGNNEAVWFLTGASSGFGREMVKQLLNQGKRVVATARDPSKLASLVKGHEGRVLALKLDVTSRSQAEAAVAQSVQHFGRIDVLVNNAGYGYTGAIEEGDEAEVREMFDTNFFGAARMIHLVLPTMRAQRSGLIINISSIAGLVGFPGLGYYSATKFALEGLSEALRGEVSPLGIQVMAVEPSGFRTDFAGRSIVDTKRGIADYTSSASKVKQAIHDYHGKQAGDPIKAVQSIIAAAELKHPPHHLILGEDAFRKSAQKSEAFMRLIQEQKEIALAADFPK